MTDDLKAMLGEIEERANAATPEYMTEHPKLKHYNNYLIGVDCCDEEPFVIADMNRAMEFWINDLQFIAHARADIPKLLAVIERLIERDNERLEASAFVPEADIELSMLMRDAELVKIMRSEK